MLPFKLHSIIYASIQVRPWLQSVCCLVLTNCISSRRVMCWTK